MFKLLSQEIKTISAKMAENLLKMNTFESQRNINEKHLSYLCDESKKKTLITGHIALARNGEGKEFLINGQHLLTTSKKTGLPVKVLFEKYEASTKEDVSELFRKFDMNMPRTLGHIVKVEADSLEIPWRRKTISLVVSAAAVIENKLFAHKSVKVELLKKWINEGEFINEIFAEDKIMMSRHLMRVAVVAVMMMTWNKHHEMARIFWKQTRDGESLSKDMPSYILRNWLLNISIESGRGASPGRGKITATFHEAMSKCITTWNAYRLNQKTNLKYFSDKPVPKVL